MKKILFIYPSADSQLGFNYGVAHMSAVLKDAGHGVSFWQLCEELDPLPTSDEFVTRVLAEAPDILAFSVVTNQWEYTKTLAGWIRDKITIPLVLGGIHALVGVEEVLQTGLFDYVFRGECEDAFLEFVERLDQGQELAETPNMAWRQGEQIQRNPLRRLPDLTRLPLKDYTCMDFQRMIDAKDGWVGLMCSRGCPFSCSYCFNHVMVDQYRKDLSCSFGELNYLRHFDVPRVMEEIRTLLNHYRHIKMFILDDDLFTFDKEYVRDFCAAYVETCDIPFVVNAHVGYFDTDRARYLAEANCRIVKFGVESGSEQVRAQILNRHMTNDKIVKAIATVNDRGMHSSVFLIIGFPHETAEDVWDTVRLMGQSRPGRFRWTFFFPFPGTKSHEISEQGGYLNHERMKALKNFTDQSCLDFDPTHSLFLKKVGRIMPWFVNACSDLPVREFYRQKVDELLALDEAQWERVSPTLLDQDKQYSEDFSRQGLSHYAVKYNRFMGVLSDYFLNE